ncbi:MAG: hypothetical protein JKX81_12680 [Arenicella sp.]|nr:hypothetical protein [Arenicella sp.]
MPNITGQIIHQDDSADWLSMIEQYRVIKGSQPETWSKLGKRCSEHVHKQNSWQPVFDAVLGTNVLGTNVRDNNCRSRKGSNSSQSPISHELDNVA